jgi:HEAT repeat protein
MLVIAEVFADMQLPRIRFTVRRLMVVVGFCALLVWIAPICFKYGWMWSVLRDVKNGQSMRYSAEGFARIGPRSVQALREALTSDQKTTRSAALRSLGMIASGDNAAVRDLVKPAIPDLINALRDKDDDVRMWAAIALGHIGPDAVSAVEPLVGLLKDEQNAQVISSAIRSLGEIGPGAKPALPILVAMVQNPGYPARVFATQAFWRIGPKGRAEASIVVPVLIDQLVTSKDTRMREWVTEILCEIGSPAQEAFPALSTAAADLDPKVRRAASKALEAITGSLSATEVRDTKAR